MEERIPLIHITDLFNPPEDPDDHFDLTVVLSLKQFDLRLVVIDNVVPVGVPGIRTVEKASKIFYGRSIPCFSGLKNKLISETDMGYEQPLETQLGVKHILDTLHDCQDGSVVITVVCSLRDVCAAYNREPELFRRKIKKLVVNAGDSYGKLGPEDWNTNLDIQAWRRMMTSGLPIDWYPCNPSKGRGGPSPFVTYWSFVQKNVFDKSSKIIKDFFDSEGIDTDSSTLRHMWSVVSFLETAEMQCCLHKGKLRWMSSDDIKTNTGVILCKPYIMRKINYKLSENATAIWEIAHIEEESVMRIFEVLDKDLYQESMVDYLSYIYMDKSLLRAGSR